MGQYIDFAYVKQNAVFQKVLEHYKVWSQGTDEELRCRCPFHDDEKPSMSVNAEKNVFVCHADTCGEKGNILEFVAGMEGADNLRDAAIKLADICKIGLAAPKTTKTKGQSRRRGGQPHDKKGRSKPVTAKRWVDERQIPPAKSRFGHDKKPGAPPFEDGQETGKKPEPLTFDLQLDPKHPYGQERGFSDWQIETFGMGYCSRGTMKGRWCIPIHNELGQLVAYTGRWVEDELPEDVPRWKLPKGFDKSQVVFNLHRLIEAKAGDFVLVEGIFDVSRLAEDGINAVALLGSSISEAQVALLKSQPFIAAYVALDSGADKAQDKVVARVAREWLTRSLILPEGEDPASVEYEWLQWHMPNMPPAKHIA